MIHIRGFLIFMLWVMTSFVCHYCTKRFLATGVNIWSSELVTHAMVGLLTVTQVTLWGGVCFSGDIFSSGQRSRMVSVVVISHAVASYCTNHSFAAVQASATMIIKTAEPLTTALMSFIIFGRSPSRFVLVSLPVAVVGAVGFAQSPENLQLIVPGIAFAMLSNISLGVRNIAMKSYLSECSFRTKISLGRVVWNCLILTCAVFCLRVFLPASIDMKYAWYLPCLLTISGIFHALYSYVSMNMVLENTDVTSHALINMCKRVVIVLLLYCFGQSTSTLWNWAMFCVCLLGLGMYVYGTRSGSPKQTGEFTCI